MPQIKATVTDEFMGRVKQFQEERGIKTTAAALSQLAAIGWRTLTDETIDPVNQWGGVRIQCEQCGGWNVGELDGERICADCGYSISSPPL